MTYTITIEKNQCHEYHKFHDFPTYRADHARPRGHRILERLLSQLQFTMEKLRAYVFTIFQRFFVQILCVSVPRHPLYKPKKRELCHIHGTDILNCESTCHLIDVPALIYDRKTATRRFDTMHDFLLSFRLVQSHLKGRNAQIWHSGNRRVQLIYSSNPVLDSTRVSISLSTQNFMKAVPISTPH